MDVDFDDSESSYDVRKRKNQKKKNNTHNLIKDFRIGDIVKIKYKNYIREAVGTIISLKPLKVFEGLNHKSYVISLKTIKLVSKKWKPTMAEFYRYASDDCAIFTYFYEKYPFDLNYIGPLLNEEGRDERDEYNPNFCPSFLMSALGWGLTNKDNIELGLYMLDKGANPTHDGWKFIMESMYYERYNQVDSRAQPLLIKMLEHPVNLDPFCKIMNNDKEIYPLWEYSKLYPLFKARLLSIPRIKDNVDISLLP